MRYIGNKTKLLDFIGARLAHLGIRGGRALDAFAGTATVGAFLKTRGFTVMTSDVMTYSYVFQRAYVVADHYPAFRALRADAAVEAALRHPVLRAAATDRMPDAAPPAARRLAQELVYLDTMVDGERGFITHNFSDGSRAQRTYFTRDNAGRIDAIRRTLHEWRASRLVGETEFFLLLASLIEAADTVANTTGVYAAYVKSWQSNARRPLRLKLPLVGARGAGAGRCRAFLGDASRAIVEAGALDVLYLDPPYNTRQYSGYYHVPELLARGWFDGDLPALRGKTGLILNRDDQRSDWSSRSRCVGALETLLAGANARHVLLSYNNEGIIPAADIRRALRAYGQAHTYRCFSRHYRRYRADTRAYSADSTVEYLHYVSQ
ncbi:MAG: DNA adenine methylase [Gemmatimonadaceae bacterium]